MTDTTILDTLVLRALGSGHDSSRINVIRKELLHYDILYCLKEASLLDGLVFQGGTSLRLCYGGSRYSEDLDFVGGPAFTSSSMAELKHCIESYVTDRYGLEVTVKEPASLRRQEAAHASLNVDKWQVSVVTDPGHRSLPKQRVKIEVANIPTYTKTDRTLQNNYQFLPSGYTSVRIPVETLDEIMADKLVALAASHEKLVRHRDMWDLVWLTERGAKLRPDLVERKIEDYGEPDYKSKLESIIERMPSLITDNFRTEMKRFLHPDAHARALGDPGFEAYLVRVLTDAYKDLGAKLYTSPGQGIAYTLPTP